MSCAAVDRNAIVLDSSLVLVEELVSAQFAQLQRSLAKDLDYTLDTVARHSEAAKLIEEDATRLRAENHRLVWELQKNANTAATTLQGSWKLDELEDLKITSVVPSPEASFLPSLTANGHKRDSRHHGASQMLNLPGLCQQSSSSSANLSTNEPDVRAQLEQINTMKHEANDDDDGALSDSTSEGLAAVTKSQNSIASVCRIMRSAVDVPKRDAVMRGSKFEILPVWLDENRVADMMELGLGKYEKGQRRQSLRRVSTTLFAPSNEMNETGKSHQELQGTWRCSRIAVVNPNSGARCTWDFLSFLLIVYDVVAIPLRLSFDLPENFILTAMLWITRVFWTLDLIGSFNTGFVRPDGFVEMRHLRIAQSYIRSWLALDLLLVVIDWLELSWSGGSNIGLARIGKASRAFRILRMLRVIRMKQAVRLFTERLRSERFAIFADIIKIMLVIMGSAHVSACIWYGIGDENNSRSWIAEGFFNHDSVGYRYLTSLHWSLSQFSGGMDEVRPYNLKERFYAIVVFILAFMMAAVLTSSLTSSMTRLHMLATRQSQQLSALRRFLLDMQVSRTLGFRVQRNAQHALLEQQRYQKESNVELLGLISEPLRMELHFEMYSSTLVRHPFFQRYLSECPHVMRKVCHYSTSTSLVSSRDIIFNAGEVPMRPKMFFVGSGTFDYYPISGKDCQVQTGDWIAEACLWIPWMHRGSLRANVDCRLCELDAKSFQEIVGQFEHSQFDPKTYAAFFAEALNRFDGEVDDLTKAPSIVSGRRRSRISVEGAVQVLNTVRRKSGEISQELVRRLSAQGNTAPAAASKFSTPIVSGANSPAYVSSVSSASCTQIE